ncbi:MAG: ATP-binding protein [Acidobacteriota bacterium]
MSRLRAPLVAALVMVALAALLFDAFQRQMSGAWFAFALHPEALALLERSLEDQKTLAESRPDDEAVYRRHFGEIQKLLQRLRVLEHNRDALSRRYEAVLLGLFLSTITLTVGFLVLRQRRDEKRLEHLGHALGDLAAGQTDLVLGERGGDVIGRIARMVEETSRRMARDRRRLRSLENLSAWQEAARRHAHEMKTPLTGARLELERLQGLLRRCEDGAEPARQAADGVRHELDRLGRFTQEFTSFARLPRPSLRSVDLDRLASDFVGTFEGAWPQLDLEHQAGGELPRVDADRDMLRQVLVNLCDNSAHALDSRRRGQVVLRTGCSGDQVWLEVADDGPGVPSELRARLFEPYVTTRGIGEGMGLGLAICRKIMLDHGGDLELRPAGADGSAAEPGDGAGTGATGATFRLSVPVPQPPVPSG